MIKERWNNEKCSAILITRDFSFFYFFFSIKREQTVIKFIKFDQIQLMDEKDWIREYD